MIPRITHSRSQLVSHLNEYDGGALSFFVSTDTYPKLFDFHFPEIVAKAPKGWCQKKLAYLWFPPDALDEDDLENVKAWKEKFEHYVLLGLNPYIEDHFDTELDFCMALDYNFDPGADRRTMYGEAEFQLKYRDSRPHLQVLKHALCDAIRDLPIPAKFRDSIALSYVPAAPDVCSVPRKLASAVADEDGYDLIDATLNCPKAGLKGVSVEEKIPIWQELYDSDCVELSDSVKGRLVVVIDDLYQSGATLWMYAKFLKEQGATHVIGLPCVKSLRDSDNQ
jgi:hypothetical protein